MFRALVLNSVDNKTVAKIESLTDSDLPEGDVIINVEYSSLNYKDGLAITGKEKIVRTFPMVPGIDLAGTVTDSTDPRFVKGDVVLATGWGMGETQWGGLSQRVRVKGDMLVPVPTGMTTKQAMALGTAGLTAMLCTQYLLDAGVRSDVGKVLVTGASGGVGSIAVSLLSTLGFSVSAVSGRVAQNNALLTQLGATEVIERTEFESPARPLEKQLWAAAIDTTGGDILAKVLAQMEYLGVVTACGLAASAQLNTTVMPFILRNVRLQGIDSVMCPQAARLKAWQTLFAVIPSYYYDTVTKEISLDEVPAYAQKLMNGEITGRIVVAL